MGETDDFEWDEVKNAQNRTKHGLPFEVAGLLFDGRPRLDRISPKTSGDEERFETIAKLEDAVLMCVWTWRGGRRRIISFRIAKRTERRAYEEAVGTREADRQDD